MVLPAEVGVVGVRVDAAPGRGRRDRHLDLVGDRAREVVLEGEDVAPLRVVAAGPDVGLVARADELHADADPLGGAPHAALDDVVHVQVAADRRDALPGGRAPGGGRAGEDGEPFRVGRRELRRQLLGHPGREVAVRVVVAEVVERQHEEAGSAGRRRPRNRTSPGRAAGSRGGAAVST